MVRKVALFSSLILGFTVSLAAAQQPPPPLGSSNPQPSLSVAAPQEQLAPSSATTPPTSQQVVGLPSRVIVDFVKPTGSDSTVGWVVALVTAAFSLLGVALTATIALSNSVRSERTKKELSDDNAALQLELAHRKTETERELAQQKAKHEAQLARQKEEHEVRIAALNLQHSASQSASGQDFTLSLEEKRIAVEREKLLKESDTRGIEIRIAAEKLVHEKQVEEAKLIHLYFDRLIPESPGRELALVALSAFIDKSVIERLVLAGDEEGSRSILSQFARRDNDTAQGLSEAEASATSAVGEPANEAPATRRARDDGTSAASPAAEVQEYLYTEPGPGKFVMPYPKPRG